MKTLLQTRLARILSLRPRAAACVLGTALLASLPGYSHAADATATATAFSSSTATASSRLATIVQRGSLRACTTGDYKPYSYLRPDGTFEGIDIDLTQSLARSLGVKVEFVHSSWSNLMKDFLAQCDIAVGGVSTSLERQKLAFFTHPYMVDGKTPIARCTDVRKYQTIAEIDKSSVRVIVNPGGTNEKFARQFLPHAQLIVYPDNVTVFKQILAGKADLMVTDASETLLQQKLNPGLCSIHPDQPFQYGEKAFMLPQGDVVWQQYVDQWLHLTRASGEYQTIFNRWLK